MTPPICSRCGRAKKDHPVVGKRMIADSRGRGRVGLSWVKIRDCGREVVQNPDWEEKGEMPRVKYEQE